MIDTSKPVDTSGNRYCGPLVVAAILGTSTGMVASALCERRVATGGKVTVGNGKLSRVRRVRAKTADTLKGTHLTELMTLLESHGFVLTPVDVGARYIRHSNNRSGYDCYVNAEGTQQLRRPIALRDTFPIDLAKWSPWNMVERTAEPLWRVAMRTLRDGGTYIVNTPGHWALASDGKWCETFTRGQWVPIAAAPKNGRKVLNAWRVTK